MGIKDLFITPIYIILLSLLAFVIRPYVTDEKTRRYFMPALWVRFAGAILLGLIYQYYYEGGDTFAYWEHGSAHIWRAMMDDFALGVQILLGDAGDYDLGKFEYVQRIWYYRDPRSFFVVRVAAIFDLFTFSTYSSTALFFGAFSFSGSWALFQALNRKYPGSSFQIAIAILFVPSTILWGSGILKDTITLGALNWMVFGIFNWIELDGNRLKSIVIIVVSALLVAAIKLYILALALPLSVIWIYLRFVSRLPRQVPKFIVAPVMLAIATSAGYLAVTQITSFNEHYSIENLAQTAMITAYDIRYGWGARDGIGSGYSLGELDGTLQSMILLMPGAINVTLFRPYPWEIRNPLMAFSALESFAFFMLALLVLFRAGMVIQRMDPFITFAFLFSIAFAFAVGVSTYNFGTLMRYKIPCLPYFMLFCVLVLRPAYHAVPASNKFLSSGKPQEEGEKGH